MLCDAIMGKWKIKLMQVPIHPHIIQVIAIWASAISISIIVVV